MNIQVEKGQLIGKKEKKKLLEKLNKFRRNDGSYDCIVSGSGGKDSSMTSHLLKIQIWNASTYYNFFSFFIHKCWMEKYAKLDFKGWF